MGVTISQDLSWNDHVDITCAKVKSMIGFLPGSHKPTLLDSPLVCPILEYYGAVWAPHTVSQINQLERVQGFAAKLATGRWSQHGCEVVFQLGWPSLAKRRDYCICRRILSGEH